MKCRLCGEQAAAKFKFEPLKCYYPLGVEYHTMKSIYTDCSYCGYEGPAVDAPSEEDVFAATKQDLLDKLQNASEAREWNDVAIKLLDLVQLDPPQDVVNALVQKALMVPQDRGTLLFALREMQAKLKLSQVIDLILLTFGQAPGPIGEAAYEAEMMLFDDLWEDDGTIPEQIKRLEAHMHATGDNSLLDAYDVLIKKVAKVIELQEDTKFPMTPWPIAVLNVRAADLAVKMGFKLHEWEEDGLGLAKGFAAILPTGLWVLVREQQHLIDCGACKGPTVEVGAEVTEHSDALLGEVMSAFGLTDADVQTKRIKNTDNWT